MRVWRAVGFTALAVALVAGAVLFMLFAWPRPPDTTEARVFADDGPFVVVTRRLEGDDLIWTYPGKGEMRLERVCRLTPEEALVRWVKNTFTFALRLFAAGGVAPPPVGPTTARRTRLASDKNALPQRQSYLRPSTLARQAAAVAPAAHSSEPAA